MNYNKRGRVGANLDYETNMTKQAFAEETNINAIMAKYQATGQFTHVNHNPAMYGDFSKINNLQEAIDQVDAANEIFMSLPAEVRSKFDNNPAKFIDFSQMATAEQLLEHGVIVEAPQQSEQVATTPPPMPAETPAEPTSDQTPS